MSKAPAKPRRKKPKAHASGEPQAISGAIQTTDVVAHPDVAEGEVERLHYALHVISGLHDPTEMRRIAAVTMAGEKHGHEI